MTTRSHIYASQNTNADDLSRIGSVSKEYDRSDEFDEDRNRQISYECRDYPVGGHWGMNETFRAIKSQYFWPNIRCEVGVCKAMYEPSGKQDANP